MHCSSSQKTFHLLSISNGSTRILSNVSVTLWKSHKTIIVGYFWRIINTCDRCFWDVSEMSRNRHLFWDMHQTSQRHLTKDIFFEMSLIGLKDVTKSHLFWDVSWKSLRCLSQWRSDWDLSKISRAAWVKYFTALLHKET